MIVRKTKMLWVLLGSVVFTMEAYPCSISSAISNLKLVNDADSIIRAIALEYASPPNNPQIWTTGVSAKYCVQNRAREWLTSGSIPEGVQCTRIGLCGFDAHIQGSGL